MQVHLPLCPTFSLPFHCTRLRTLDQTDAPPQQQSMGLLLSCCQNWSFLFCCCPSVHLIGIGKKNYLFSNVNDQVSWSSSPLLLLESSCHQQFLISHHDNRSIICWLLGCGGGTRREEIRNGSIVRSAHILLHKTHQSMHVPFFNKERTEEIAVHLLFYWQNGKEGGGGENAPILCCLLSSVHLPTTYQPISFTLLTVSRAEISEQEWNRSSTEYSIKSRLVAFGNKSCPINVNNTERGVGEDLLCILN